MMIKQWTSAATLLLVLSVPALAQQPQTPDQPKAPGPGMMHEGMHPGMLNVEAALRMKEQLKLSDAQTAQLDAIRKEMVAERQAHAQTMIDVESRLAAGLIKREDVRKQFEGKADAMRQTFQQRQDRVAKILTQEQQEQVQRMSRRMMMRSMRSRGFEGGRGRGFAGQRMRRRFRGGMHRGMGQGFGPGEFGGRRFYPGFDQDWAPRPPLPPHPPRVPGNGQ